MKNRIYKILDKFRGSTKEETPYNPEVIAYHEAGQAVMAYLLGNPVSEASVLKTVCGVGDENYHLVKALAEALLEKGIMTGEEVQDLLNRENALPRVTYLSKLSKEETRELFYSVLAVN